MKQLLLMRHAKSSWNDARLADVDRPLNERGLRNAPEMGQRLVRRGEVPDLIVSSHARRALQTAQLVADACGIARAEIEIVDALYATSPATWFKQIRALPEARNRVLMVGHNPEISEVAQALCPAADIDEMPTGAVLRLDFGKRGWSTVGRAAPDGWHFDYPKNVD